MERPEATPPCDAAAGAKPDRGPVPNVEVCLKFAISGAR